MSPAQQIFCQYKIYVQNPNGMDTNEFIYLLSTWSRNHLSGLNDVESLKLSR